jgi:methyltransferase
VDTSKPSAVFQPTGGRRYTLSVALPGSIISNAKSHEQKTFLAGQIARALAVYCVDEVVIFDDESAEAQSRRAAINDNDYTAFSHPDHFLAHLLSYLETPPHLRKALFPMHPNLRTAGTLPSLDMPHHLRANEWCEYREGVTTTVLPNNGGTLVDTGLPGYMRVPEAEIPSNTRVTVHLHDEESKDVEVVSPNDPREQKGYYWGYTVRQCGGLTDVFTECPFDGGYDISIGTSERGRSLSEVLADKSMRDPSPLGHVLLVFGGVAGLETAARNDRQCQEMGLSGDKVHELFDVWVNLLPGQGSRTIRTEEAVWIGLMGFRSYLEQVAHAHEAVKT